MGWSRPIFAGLLALLVGHGVQADPCNLDDPTLVKPDLTALSPVRARVVQRDGYRRLYFTTKIANLGQGPLRIDAKTVDTPFGPVTQASQVISRSDGSTCTHAAGTFEFHTSHNHFHLDDFAEYQLRKDDPYTGVVVARASKVSFCLTDVEPQRGFTGQRQVYSNCGVQEGTQGISSGWADVYDDFYPEQYIELDLCRDDGGVPAGQYWLVNVADPDNFLVEVKDDFVSNAGVVSIDVPARLANQPVPPCDSVPTPQPPPTRPNVTPLATNTPTIAPPSPTSTPTPGRRRPVRPPRPPRPTRIPGPVHDG